MTDSNVHVLYEALPEDPEREAIIESLLMILQEVRRGNISSLAIVACSEDYSRTLSTPFGVRMDMTPQIVGLMAQLSHEMMVDYTEAIHDINDSGAP